jgi:hypothetical protein
MQARTAAGYVGIDDPGVAVNDYDAPSEVGLGVLPARRLPAPPVTRVRRPMGQRMAMWTVMAATPQRRPWDGPMAPTPLQRTPARYKSGAGGVDRT